ncbi:TetR family transcriptional regulator [soil metagenome]
MVESSPSRPRNAAATRQAILTSAREAFVRSGYDGAGVREIAAGAVVTAMLVNRYFGSKEKLFAEVLADIFGGPRVLTEALMRSSSGPRDLATAVVDMTATDAPALDGFIIMTRSMSNPRATEIGREQIEAHHQASVAAGLVGPHAAERAGMVLAVVSGFQTMRQAVGVSTLAKADREILITLLEPIFRGLIQGQPAT